MNPTAKRKARASSTSRFSWPEPTGPWLATDLRVLAG